MLRRSSFFLMLLGLMVIVSALTGCVRKRAYTDYAHIASDGWMRKDTLKFNVAPLKEAGDYCLRLGLRTDNDYPYLNCSVIVEQRLYPDGHVFVDTLQLDLTRENGNSIGTGVNLYQYVFDVDTLYLDLSDSLVISVRHDIKTDTLNGISDVGVELVR